MLKLIIKEKEVSWFIYGQLLEKIKGLKPHVIVLLKSH